MKKFRSIVNVSCFIFLFFRHSILINSEKALIFNKNYEIFGEIPEIAGEYYSACPAELKLELEFNETKSVTKSSLFLRDYIEITEEMVKKKQLSYTPLTECENSYKPSMLVYPSLMQFEIGFEIYYNIPSEAEMERWKERFSTIAELKSNYRSKDEPRGILSSIFSLKRKSSKLRSSINKKSPSEKVIQTDSERITKSNVEDTVDIRKKDQDKPIKKLKKLPSFSFHWMPIFYFNFDLEKCTLKKIVYSGNLGKFGAGFKCSEYIEDPDLYKDTDLNSLYERDNQVKIFEGLPIFHEKYTASDNPTSIYRCGLAFGCLKQHQVIPHYYYHSQAARLSSCVAVNTLPVWESISDGALKRVDQYLYVITQIWGPNITITTETLGVMSFPKGKTIIHKRSPFLQRKLYMDPEYEKVPVPKIIYKIVEYRKNAREQYHLVIVTHNNPTSKKMKHICQPPSKNETYEKLLLSWAFLYNTNFEEGWTYACPMATETLDNLGIIRRRSSDERLSTLFLNDFPPIYKDGERLTIEQKRQMIEKNVGDLFGSGA